MAKVVYIAIRGKQAYEVSRSRDGSVSCNCAGYITRGKCRHITEYRERQAAHKEGEMKKRKKSLVGWTWEGWKSKFNKDYGRICIPEMYCKPKKGLFDDNDIKIKIRITIEEL